MKYRVKNSNKTAAVTVSVLFTAAILLFILSVAVSSYRSLIQFGMMALVVAAMLVAERYLISTFDYVIEKNDGEPDLVVYKNTGRKTATQCRMSLFEAEKLVRCRKGTAVQTVGKVYDYTGTVSPDKYVLLFFPGESATLKLEPDENFTLVIEKLITRPDNWEVYNER